MVPLAAYIAKTTTLIPFLDKVHGPTTIWRQEEDLKEDFHPKNFSRKTRGQQIHGILKKSVLCVQGGGEEKKGELKGAEK